MTRIVLWAAHNTRPVLALIAVVIIAGVYAFVSIPKEADPDLPIPYISVWVNYPGISPEDSERLLVKPLEANLRSIEGIKTMTGRAREGGGSVTLEFNADFNKQKALEDVRAQVDATRPRLPPEADPPGVWEANTSSFPVITVALSGDLPERTLVRLARNLRDELKTIPSVLEADLSGAPDELLEVTIDPAKLESYGITMNEVYSAVSGNNSLIAAGSIDTGHGSFKVTVPGVIATAQDVLDLPIRSTADSTVTLKDVASVRRTFYDRTTYARMNGLPTVAIDVSRRTGTNIIANNEQVRALVARVQKTWPPGVHVNFMFDQSTFIRDQLGSLSDSILLAVLLVMIIIVAALGIRSGLLVGVAIPTSFLMSFMVLNGFGMTLNFMIMFGMLLAVGILVDGAIIVVEYADRKMTEGHTPREAFAEAAVRMFWPVVSATATMVGAFLPMLLWPGMVGKYMSYFPITLIIVLSSSMVVALIFLPVLGGIFGKPPLRDETHEKAIEASETGDWREIPGITGWYAHLAARLTRHPGKVIGGALGVAFLIILGFAFFNKGVEFFVKTDPDFANVYVSARGNLSAVEKRDLVMSVEKRIEGIDGLQYIYATSGHSGNDDAPVDNIGRVMVELKPYEQRRPGNVILEEIRKRTEGMAGLHIEVTKPGSGPSNGKDIDIEVTSDNYPEMAQVTDALRRHMDKQPELRDVEDTRSLPGIEWHMTINRELASRFGVNAQQIGTAVQLVTNGVFIARYRPDDTDNEVDIRVRYPSHARGVHALDGLRIATSSGALVPISNFVTMTPAKETNDIERKDMHRVYHVRANMKPNTILPNAEMDKLKTWIGKQSFPSEVRVNFGGSNQDSDESAAFLKIAAFMALFLIAMVLLVLFNSFYHTFLILVAVIMAVIGALLGMLVMGQTFSLIMTGTGMLALAGIVVNHNIVLIDTYHRLRLSGMEPIEAVIRSSAQRLRPVFLTTVTAIGGLLPMMFAIEIDFWQRTVTIGAPTPQMWVQLSTAVIFGLAFSKMITLGLVPAMLALPYRMRETEHGFLWTMAAALRAIGGLFRFLWRMLMRLFGRTPQIDAQPAE
ncbi:MAG: efflux RND transporter permease subunit [Alphaproteobacteria bacterium]|nr:efflux RND transporter permease subunit [Alphaproteobacteria bacterium]MDE2110182.1 efflux RND transporter permease subunit [Alphaproteobacteria bacterium]MDE2492516.1 efflux RND transporter permease subunit [Alphaproteobacteria bacterium]